MEQKYSEEEIKKAESILGLKFSYCIKCNRLLTEHFFDYSNKMCNLCFENNFNNPRKLLALKREGERKCTRCLKVKPALEKYFPISRSSKNGLSPICKECSEFRSNRKRCERAGHEIEFTITEWEECKKFFNYKCAYCGKEEKLSQDHIIPFIENGQYEKSNIVPACKSCNSKKHKSNMEHWYIKQDFFSNERLNKIKQWIKN